MDVTTKPLVGAKLVYVQTYVRFRFGRWEWVSAHFRGWPRT
jgi:hypothetical protein